MPIIRTEERKKQTGEIFTPDWLVWEMLEKLPADCFTDKTKTFLDPACGDGNFLVVVKQILMETLSTEFPDAEKREQHILEDMIFGIDIMPDNIEECRRRLGITDGSYGSRNIVCFNSLLINDGQPGHEIAVIFGRKDASGSSVKFKPTKIVKPAVMPLFDFYDKQEVAEKLVEPKVKKTVKKKEEKKQEPLPASLLAFTVKKTVKQ